MDGWMDLLATGAEFKVGSFLLSLPFLILLLPFLRVPAVTPYIYIYISLFLFWVFFAFLLSIRLLLRLLVLRISLISGKV
jgi:hypothetical protein